MLHLFSPTGLWALASLALPLAIHLWRPPPQTIRLGSLRFLDHLPHRRLRNLRWRERALLAVRLGLLTALALLLASPHWRHAPPAGPQRWALLDPTALPSGDAASRLRQLRANGYTARRLAPGFPSFDSPAPPASPDAPVPAPELWSLLLDADSALPAGSTLAVFTPGRLAALQGARPSLRHCRVDWITTAASDGTKAPPWIERLESFAPSGQPAAARAIVGTSDAASTRFAAAFSPPVPGASPNLGVEWSSDRTSARLPGGAWLRATKPPADLRVAIFHDAARTEDARCVAAALRAVSAVTNQPVTIETQVIDNHPVPTRSSADWLWWLSATPIPAALADAAPHLFLEGENETSDAVVSTESWIVAPPDAPGAAALAPAAVRLWRRLPAAQPPGNAAATLWTDGHGDPLLTLEPTPHGQRWHFYSRFQPDWTDLPLTGALPAFVGGLLFPPPAAPLDPARDLRLADPSQVSLSLSPVSASTPPAAPPTRSDAVDLHWPLWLLAVLLFAAERLLSRRSTTQATTHPINPVDSPGRGGRTQPGAPAPGTSPLRQAPAGAQENSRVSLPDNHSAPAAFLTR